MRTCVSEQGRSGLLWTVFDGEPFCSPRIASFADENAARDYAYHIPKELAALRTQLVAAEARAELAEGLLHDLTPTGSEFVGRPQKCFQWVSDHVSDLMRIAVDATAERRTEHEEAQRLKRKLQEAEARDKAIRDTLVDAVWYFDHHHAYWTKASADVAGKCRAALANTSGGEEAGNG